ncbi:MAG: two-component system, NarL family, sensor kinase [Solirubrobacteraceae bacterium]|nr:two-component system, NarL family, sensor kinase [Solirubrobacteraceae bacterium]
MFGRRNRDLPDGRSPEPPGAVSAVTRFVLGSLAAIAVVVVGGFFALRSVTINEAERNTREQVQVEGRLIQSAGLADGVLHRGPRALARLDALVRSQILDGSVVRVKLWSADGTILYSDEPRLIGKRFALAADERRILRGGGGADAELSDLSKPENRYERHEGKLLEAHTVIRTPGGTPVLFEIYQRFGSVSASAERQLRALAPPLLGGLLVLLLFQVPLAWRLARRLQRGHRERERLLASAIESSSQERGRIAAGLHDGVVQDLAGVAFGLAPLAEDAERRGAPQAASELREATDRLRQGVRDLRSLLVDIHPPSLESAGLEATLSDLLSPLAADGITTELHVDDGAASGSGEDALVYRVAREAVRNARAHANAATVCIELTRRAPNLIRLVVEDDGRGFEAGERERRAAEGHVGLSLLEDVVRQAGGRLSVQSRPGSGTTVELELATR